MTTRLNPYLSFRGQAPWGDSFGMCVDRFGVPWMVNIAGSPA
ncbi:hypothetical protein [Aeromicrobium terrae]|nr:hypothetical protein [Aeromicrobium terrae]